MPAHPNGDRSRIGPVRLGFCLVAITAMAPLLQYAVPALAPFLVDEFSLSTTGLGLYSSILFASCAVVSPTVGRWADRFSARALALVVFGTGGLAAFLIAGAVSYSMLLGAAILVSIPMSLAHPLTNHLVLNLSRGRSRGILVAVKHSGIKIALTVAGFTMAPIAAVSGWRTALVVPLLVSLFGVAAVPRLLGTERKRPDKTQLAKSSVPSQVRWLAAFAFCMGMSQSAFGAYIALFAFEEVGASRSTAGMIAGALGVTGVLATPCLRLHTRDR